MGTNMALMAIAAQTAASRAPRRWINGPWVDFLTLGGGSFLVLGALAAFWPRDDASRAALAGAMLLLAHVVNHPHFAHSYQLFYREFTRKAFRDEGPLAARRGRCRSTVSSPTRGGIAGDRPARPAPEMPVRCARK